MRLQSNLNTLFKNYKDSGGDYELAPSCDRLNDEVGYSLSNIQLGTYRENKEREYAKQRKAVIQMDLEGNFIKEWSSVKEAARELGLKSASSISMVCRGEKKTAGGYKFKYS